MFARISLLMASLMLIFVAPAHAGDCVERIDAVSQRLAARAEGRTAVGAADGPSAEMAQVRNLVETARVLAETGQEQACIATVEEAEIELTRLEQPAWFSAERLIGYQVKGRQGEPVGEVKHLIVNLDRGVISFAVVSLSGVLGIGDDLKPLPFTALTPDFEDETLRLKIDRAKLENAPSYDSEITDTMLEPDWLDAIYGYYGLDPRRDSKTVMASRAKSSEDTRAQTAASRANGDTEPYPGE